jgi:hypothetical protein
MQLADYMDLTPNTVKCTILAARRLEDIMMRAVADLVGLRQPRNLRNGLN